MMPLEEYYSNGKLLLTGEYVVLDGASSLAVPTKFGQHLVVKKIKEPQLIWGSFTNEGECWFEAVFDLEKVRLVSATFTSEIEGSADRIAETLLNIIVEAKKMNPTFLSESSGYLVKTTLEFPQNWGLGSSSTLLNNIANWAKVDVFQLLWNAFSGSGYDVACASHNTPIFYQLTNNTPQIKPSSFNPKYKEQLFFIHLNKKQNSRAGIAQYKKHNTDIQSEIKTISTLTTAFSEATSIAALEKVMVAHEALISSLVKIVPVKQQLFSDYRLGEVKSLGAWGGDFVLATGNEKTPTYFKNKGFETILSYDDMVL